MYQGCKMRWTDIVYFSCLSVNIKCTKMDTEEVIWGIHISLRYATERVDGIGSRDE